MKTVNLSTLEFVGGIKSMEVYNISDVKNCPHNITINNVHTIVFEQSNSDIQLYPIAYINEFKERPKVTDSGIQYNIQGGFVVQAQDTEVDPYFHPFMGEKVMVKVFYLNGNNRLYGSVVSPLDFTYNPYNGKDLENGSGYRVNITGITTQKPVYF